jgi:hypothetical protein
MAIDVSKIDDRIRKLQELRRIASDPELADLLAELVSVNGHQNQRSPFGNKPVVEVNAGLEPEFGQFTRIVRQVCSTLPGRFSIRDVMRELEKISYQITAQKPLVAVGGVLRKLADPKRKVLRLVEESSGRKPNFYEFIKDSARTSAD